MEFPPRDYLNCSICIDILENPMKLPCKHFLCQECWTKLVQTSATRVVCPECRLIIKLPSKVVVDEKLKQHIRRNYSRDLMERHSDLRRESFCGGPVNRDLVREMREATMSVEEKRLRDQMKADEAMARKLQEEEEEEAAARERQLKRDEEYAKMYFGLGMDDTLDLNDNLPVIKSKRGVAPANPDSNNRKANVAGAVSRVLASEQAQAMADNPRKRFRLVPLTLNDLGESSKSSQLTVVTKSDSESDDWHSFGDISTDLDSDNSIPIAGPLLKAVTDAKTNGRSKPVNPEPRGSSRLWARAVADLRSQAGPSNLANAGPGTRANAGPNNQAKAGPSNQAKAGPSNQAWLRTLIKAGPSNQEKAGPSNQAKAGPSNQAWLRTLAKAGPSALDTADVVPSLDDSVVILN